MTHRLILTALALALASPALAQLPGDRPIKPQTVPMPPPGYSNLDNLQGRIDREQQREVERARRRAEKARAAAFSPERQARADRVAALLNQGQCAEAKTLTVAEHDADMAAKVDEFCSAR